MLISIVIPAFNEEDYLRQTLTSLNNAGELLARESDVMVEVIVVDDASVDSTADIARSLGARVVEGAHQSVAKARNAGGRAARGDVLIFVDADTLVPDQLLLRIAAAMSDRSCAGGAVDTDYRPTKIAVRIYLGFWRVIGRMMGMAQGATQFCRRDVFSALNGFDEKLFMGEDVDFYWRLKRIAKQQHSHVVLVEDLRVVPSTRRFDQWRLWRTLLWTNPLFILLFQRNRTAWDGWYKTTPR
jgi:glycosyltransferase involved in cell wall biosynthesis